MQKYKCIKNWEVYSGVTKQKEMDKGLYRISHSIEIGWMWEMHFWFCLETKCYSLQLLDYRIWRNIAEHSVPWTARVLVTTCRGKDLCCSKPHYPHMIMWNVCSLLFCIKFSIADFSKTMKNICPFVICFFSIFLRRTKLILSQHIQDSCEINCSQMVLILNAWSRDQQLLHKQTGIL